MATTRTSSRQAAQKAKEAISATSDGKSRGGAGTKRKETTEKGPERKKEKKEEHKPVAVEVTKDATGLKEPVEEFGKGKEQQDKKDRRYERNESHDPQDENREEQYRLNTIGQVAQDYGNHPGYVENQPPRQVEQEQEGETSREDQEAQHLEREEKQSERQEEKPDQHDDIERGKPINMTEEKKPYPEEEIKNIPETIPEKHPELEEKKTPEKPVQKDDSAGDDHPQVADVPTQVPKGKSPETAEEAAPSPVKAKPEPADDLSKEKEKHEPSNPPETVSEKPKEREAIVPSNILEKGVIYFFYRPRVNVTEPHSVSDIARSFFVLRPTSLGTVFSEAGPMDAEAKCRLLMLPKKKYPTSPRERDMAFVEKAGASLKQLQDSFFASETYETQTLGERTVPEAKPYAEGVYAITRTKRASHLAYVLTIPETLGQVQEDFGLSTRGSFIVQSKNPKHPGPSFAQLPKNPEYPESVLEKFGDYRWVPLEPEFLDYANAQFLMIGEAQHELGKAAVAESGDKRPEEIQPGEELEKLGEENEERVDHLRGDDTVYEDLGFHAKNHPKLPTTWA